MMALALLWLLPACDLIPDPREFQVQPNPPRQISVVDLPDDQGRALRIRWTPSPDSDIREQRIYRGTASLSYGERPVGVIPDATITEFIDTGLTPGIVYFYAVRAYDGTLESPVIVEGAGRPLDNTAPEPTTDLVAVDVPNDDGTAVRLTWTPSPSIDAVAQRIYRAVFGSTFGAEPVHRIADNTTAQFEDTGLGPGVRYQYVVRALDGPDVPDTRINQSVADLTAAVTTVDQISVAPPTGVVAVDVLADQGGAIELTWIPSADADAVRQQVLRRVADRTFSSIPLVTFADNTAAIFRDTTATTGVSYVYRVQAGNALAFSQGAADAQAVAVDNLAPQPVTGLAAADVAADGGGAVVLTWVPSSATDVVSQRIYRRTAATVFGTDPVVTFDDNTTATFIDTGLVDGTGYFYRVTAFDGTAEGEAFTGATPADNLSVQPPTGLTAADVPADQGGIVDLAWTPSADVNAVAQNIYRSTTLGAFPEPPLAALADNVSATYLDATAPNGVALFYTVRAVSTTGIESAGTTTATATAVDDLVPDAAANLTAVDVPADQGRAIQLTWTPSPSADVVVQELFRGTTSGVFGAIPVATLGDRTQASHVDIVPANGTRYFYELVVRDGTQPAPASNEANDIATDDLAPDPPTMVQLVDRPNDVGRALLLTWVGSTSADVVSHVIYRERVDGSELLHEVRRLSPTIGAFVNSGLPNHELYRYVVRAFDGTRESADAISPAAAPRDNSVKLTVGAGIREFSFSWTQRVGDDHGILRQSPDGLSVFTLVPDGDFISGNAFSLPVAAHRTDWDLHGFVVDSCSPVTCLDSDVAQVTHLELAAVGYLKAENSGFGDQNGTAVAMAADGCRLMSPTGICRVLMTAPQEDGETSAVVTRPVEESPPPASPLPVAALGVPVDDRLADAGAVHVFTPRLGNTGMVWAQEAYLKSPNPGLGDWFGDAAALSGDGRLVVVGARHESGSGTGILPPHNDLALRAGAVYGFFYDPVFGWQPATTLKAENPDIDDHFGAAVATATQGETVAVAAPGEDGAVGGVNPPGGPADNSATDAGAVYLFHFDAITRFWTIGPYLKGSNPDAGDAFGAAVAVSGDGNRVAVGAPGEAGALAGVDPMGGPADNGAPGAGAVYLFERASSADPWLQEAYVKAGNPDAGDAFGTSVSLSADGNRLVVGAPGEAGALAGVDPMGGPADNGAPGAGAVYVFVRDAGTGLWAQESYVKATTVSAGDAFGTALALSADATALVVGAPGEDGGGMATNPLVVLDQPDAGALFSYVRDAMGWLPESYIKATNPDAGDRFGTSVALSADGSAVLGGARHEDSAARSINPASLPNAANNAALSAGAAYLY